MSDKKYLPIENEDEDDFGAINDDDLGISDIDDGELILNITETYKPEVPDEPNKHEEPDAKIYDESPILDTKKREDFTEKELVDEPLLIEDFQEEVVVTDAIGDDIDGYCEMADEFEDNLQDEIKPKRKDQAPSLKNFLQSTKVKVLNYISFKKNIKKESSNEKLDNKENVAKEKNLIIENIKSRSIKVMLPILIGSIILLAFSIFFILVFKDKPEITSNAGSDLLITNDTNDIDDTSDKEEIIIDNEMDDSLETVRKENPLFKITHMGEELFLYNNYKENMESKNLWEEYNDETLISRATYEKKIKSIIGNKKELLNTFKSEDVKNYFYKNNAKDYYTAILRVLEETHQRDVNTLKFVKSDNGNRMDALQFIKESEKIEKTLLSNSRVELIHYLKANGIVYRLEDENNKYADYHVPLKDISYNIDEYLD